MEGRVRGVSMLLLRDIFEMGVARMLSAEIFVSPFTYHFFNVSS